MIRTIAIDANVHRTIEMNIHKRQEVGGTLKLVGNVLVVDATHPGKFASVVVPRGIVQFHTHPSQCNGRLCTLGIPSVQDVMGFVDAFMRDEVLIHCLYSADGCYCMSITPARASAVRKRRLAITSNLKSFFGTFDAQSMTPGSYAAFRENWIALIRSQGIAIRLYQRNVVPRFELEFQNLA